MCPHHCPPSLPTCCPICINPVIFSRSLSLPPHPFLSQEQWWRPGRRDQAEAQELVLGSLPLLHSHQPGHQRLNSQASLESQPGQQFMTPIRHSKMEICMLLMTLNLNLLSILWRTSPHLMNSSHFRKYIPAR